MFEKNEDHVHDAKIIFDSLRNIGICSVIFIAGSTIKAHNIFGNLFDIVFSYLLWSFAVFLFIINIYWLYWSLKGKPLKFWFFSPSIILFLILGGSTYAMVPLLTGNAG